jgi:hypothetical protein
MVAANGQPHTEPLRVLILGGDGFCGWPTALPYQPWAMQRSRRKDLFVENRCFLDMGLEPTTLSKGLLLEVTEVAEKYAGRCDRQGPVFDHRSKIPCTSKWVKGWGVDG